MWIVNATAYASRSFGRMVKPDTEQAAPAAVKQWTNCGTLVKQFICSPENRTKQKKIQTKRRNTTNKTLRSQTVLINDCIIRPYQTAGQMEWDRIVHVAREIWEYSTQSNADGDACVFVLIIVNKFMIALLIATSKRILSDSVIQNVVVFSLRFS